MRPLPPAQILDPLSPISFLPAPDLRDWAMATFIDDGAALENEDHAHLRSATLGFLWTSIPNGRAGRTIIGQCEMGEAMGGMGRWARSRAAQQLEEWFGEVPTFVLTFFAPYCAECPDAEACALVEHELYHAGQERDVYGAPKFTKAGSPKFAMRGHDVEEFVGVVRRYGADAAGVRQLVEAASRKPEVGSASIASACGTCLLRAA
jgi:hypothetical protein